MVEVKKTMRLTFFEEVEVPQEIHTMLIEGEKGLLYQS